jgi:hypothetical protein
MLTALGGGISPPMCNTNTNGETRTIHQNSEDKEDKKEEITTGTTTLFS